MSDELGLLTRLCALFNYRDIEGVLAAMHPDVVWVKRMEGGQVRRRDEVRGYWKRQWAIIDPHVVKPIETSPNGEGRSSSKFISCA
jgi:hypothetical protein